MNKCLKIVLMISVLILNACGSNRTYEKKFKSTKELAAEFIEIDQLLQFRNIGVTDNYVVIQNGSPKIGDIFYVYSYPEFEFLYSFGKYGRANNEYLMPSLIKNVQGDNIMFRDHGTQKISKFKLSNTGAELLKEFSLPVIDYKFYWEINEVNDSLLFMKHQSHNAGQRELWNSNTIVVVDSLTNTFPQIKKEFGKEYNTIYDDQVISVNDNRFACAYFMIDAIEIGSIENNKLMINRYLGSKDIPEFYKYGHGETSNFNIDNNIIYYEGIFAAENTIYALYSNKRLDDTEKNHSGVIETYDWNGNPKIRYILDNELACFFVDEKEKRIYGINPTLYDDKIIMYEF